MADRLASYLAVLSGDGQPVAGCAATLRSGQFHDVVLAGEMAYRFPRDEQARRRLPGRMALLSALARCSLPVAVPEPVDIAHLARPVGTCYVGVRRLHGEPAGHGLVVPEPRQAALVSMLATLLDQLAGLGSAGPVVAAVPRLPPDHWQRWGTQVRQVLFPLMSASGRRRAAAELAAVAATRASGDALVHSDLGGANLLLTWWQDAPVVSGVLDWDEACIGDQAADLAALAVTFGWAVAERVDAARRAGAAGLPMIGIARRITATFALQQALPAALSGDQQSLDDGLSGYR